MERRDLNRVSDCVWEIPRDFRSSMRVPARLYADETILEGALGDKSLEQLMNTAALPGIVKYAIAMPDIHQGYGFPIGGVVATELPDGVISPGGVGYDINCGVRVLASHLSAGELAPYKSDLATALFQNCPSGVGAGGAVRLGGSEMDELLQAGAAWALRRGFARPQDLERTEEGGVIAGADAAFVSSRAKQRGYDQVGTLGAGNHFIELDRVAQVYDETAAEALGLFPDQVVVQIHCGSRGLGHQVCEEFVSRFQKSAARYGFDLPDRELVSVPFSSPEGQTYFKAMACAANFAFANRQVLAALVRRSFERVLAGKLKDRDLDQVYDITHNMAKLEEHRVGSLTKKLCVHRKGATRAFGPGAPGLPPHLAPIGQPVLIPGSMGTASYILLGTQGSMDQTFGSSCHGAGRLMSRSRAKKQVRGQQLREDLNAQGISVRAGSLSGLAEEAPSAYKDVSRVVEVVQRAGICRKVARLEPIAVVKG